MAFMADLRESSRNRLKKKPKSRASTAPTVRSKPSKTISEIHAPSREFRKERIKGRVESLYEKAKKKYPLGEGHRFAAMKKDLAAKGAKSPGGLAAHIGRQKYGKERFQQLATAGKRRRMT